MTREEAKCLSPGTRILVAGIPISEVQVTPLPKPLPAMFYLCDDVGITAELQDTHEMVVNIPPELVHLSVINDTPNTGPPQMTVLDRVDMFIRNRRPQ